MLLPRASESRARGTATPEPKGLAEAGVLQRKISSGMTEEDDAKAAAVTQVREALLFGESVSMVRLGQGLPEIDQVLYWLREDRNPNVMTMLNESGTALALEKWVREAVAGLRAVALADPKHGQAADGLERARIAFAKAYLPRPG